MNMGGLTFSGDSLLTVLSVIVLFLGLMYTRHRDYKTDIESDATQTAMDRKEIARIATIENKLETHLLSCAEANGRVDETLHGIRADLNRLLEKFK